MTRALSLRGRLLLGAFLWTIGLFAAAVLISTAIMLRHGSYAFYLHGTAEHYATAVTLLVIVTMIGGIVQLRGSLRVFNRLRRGLAAVHAGEQRRIEGQYPGELQPLVDDLNALIEHRDHAIQRAQAKAGDLAHGLKTPLAVLAHEAARAKAAGQQELAAGIEVQVERMRRQMDYHLAQARAAASGATSGARTAVRDAADGIARTLQRLHVERGLTIAVNAAPDHLVRTEREDLDEMLGNLLDNGCKWAARRVALGSAARDGHIVITVDDDGAGIQASMRDAVLQRGVRADEAAPGSGFGLAIVRDLAELYGGAIALGESPLGGLRAELRLPKAQ